MQICLNGHIITARFYSVPHERKNYCDLCGKITITECSKCHEPIAGDLYSPFYLHTRQNEPPQNCEKCGKPFQWKKKKIQINGDYIEDPLTWLQNFFSRFHSIAIQLEKKYRDRETFKVRDEYDVQRIIHCFLLLKFEDIRAEEWTPSYTGQSSRMDFLLKNEGIVIESKMTKQGHGNKEIGNELLVDVRRYKERNDCKILICFIYDRDSIIENRTGFIRDLEKSTVDPKVLVFINPL
jgi:hypothetical protein